MSDTMSDIIEFHAIAFANEIKHCLTVINRAETSLISSKRRELGFSRTSRRTIRRG
jgi:hypothetical protein